MSKSSSDKRSESKSKQPDLADPEKSKAEEQSDYYYDDATGYEIYEDKDDDQDDGSEN